MFFNLIFITFSFKLFVKKLQSLGFALHFYNQSNGEQLFCSLSAHQHSPDQMKISKNQSAETMAIYTYVTLIYMLLDSMFFLYLKVLLFIIIFIRKHYYLFRYCFIISFIVIIIKYIIYQFSLFHYCNYLPLFTIVTSYILTLY